MMDSIATEIPALQKQAGSALRTVRTALEQDRDSTRHIRTGRTGTKETSKSAAHVQEKGRRITDPDHKE